VKPPTPAQLRPAGASARAWQGFFFMLALILVLDRLTNLFPPLHGFDGLFYILAILAIGLWAGLASSLASCALLALYVYLIYRFFPISVVVKDPKNMRDAIIGTCLVGPPFALAGSLMHHVLGRSRSREISARKETEHVQAELWASEEMKRLIVDSTQDAVIGIGTGGTINLWSPNAERLFGWTREEAIGQPAPEQFMAAFPANVLPTPISPERKPILRQLIETTAPTKYGGEAIVELYVVDQELEEGAAYIVFARDISERKRAEGLIQNLNEELKRLNAGLEERVADRTQELEAANEELLGFTYSVSHDLRTPLRSIVSNSRLAREEAGAEFGGDALRRLERLEASALKMANLIDSLLQYARIGRLELNCGEVDLSAMAHRIGEELRAFREGSVVVQPGIVVEGDADTIHMVLSNLMENGWKYVQPGQSPSVEVGRMRDGTIFVKDQGIGFDMAYEDKIWEPFQRLHSDSEYPGTGIGLANAKRIVERHGGRIWVTSTPGKGTEMFFTLARPGDRRSRAVG
jgi:PAS domain S-box-containing protein